MGICYDLSGYWRLTSKERDWGKIQLPGTTALAKKGIINDARETGYLTELYPWEGEAVYTREVCVDAQDVGNTMILTLERTRRTRVYVDGVCVGSCDSLTTAHVYDLTAAVRRSVFELRICVDNTGYPIGGGHLTSPDTQTNWNGILGAMTLEVHRGVWIRQIRVEPTMKAQSVQVELELAGGRALQLGSFAGEQSKEVEETKEAGRIVECKAVVTGLFPGKTRKEQDASEVAERMRTEDPSAFLDAGACVAKKQFSIPLAAAQSNHFRLQIPLTEAANWDEYNRNLYEVRVEIGSSEDTSNQESYSVITGFRTLATDARRLFVNGEQVFLRGKHDALVFPETGAAPMSIREWLRVMGIAKSYGINHYRFHTCCPPEAAFYAADLLGIYLQPELPFWGTWHAPGEKDYDEKAEGYLIAEGKRMLQSFGHHPSFCLMSLGNELWGSEARICEVIRTFRQVDATKLYTQGSNNYQFYPRILAEDDFWSGVRLGQCEPGYDARLVRGSNAACDAPMGHVQTDRPNTRSNYDKAVRFDHGRMKGTCGVPQVPLLAHEVGQYAFYPDYHEIERYQGPLRARNFEVFRERLAKTGMLPMADAFFKNAGKLAVACYKEEIESLLRSEEMSGFQLLDLQDYPGQGTALVGILNAFMENKGICSQKEWRQFCSDVVVLAEFEDYIVTAGSQLEVRLRLRDERIAHGVTSDKNRYFCYELVCEWGKPLACGRYEMTDRIRGLREILEIKLDLPEDLPTGKLTLRLAYYENDCVIAENHYELWNYNPAAREHGGQLSQLIAENTDRRQKTMEVPTAESDDAAAPASDRKNSDQWMRYQAKNGVEVLIVSEEATAQALAEQGKRVLCISGGTDGIPGAYASDFWCYPMFRQIAEQARKTVPIGTMGLCIEKEHPALALFPTEGYTTPQWYEVVTHANSAILDGTDLTPIVAMIDNFERSHKLGLIYEQRAGAHHFLICRSNLWECMEHVEVQQLLYSLLEYLSY